MTPIVLKPKNQIVKKDTTINDLSTEVNVNYSKATFDRKDNITFINVDRAINGKNETANTKTYSQNLVKKYELTGNKEVCIRKIFIAQREDGLFDVTVRELNIYYRKSKRFDFHKVVRFKSPNGSIEFVLDKLKTNSIQKGLNNNTSYLLN